MSELTALLTPEGLRLLDDEGPASSTDDVARTVSRLRGAGHSPELVSAVVGQARLRVKAAAKFGPFAPRMLFTRAGLEQATRLTVAARHAGRMRRAGITEVVDLGCGIGGDSLAFAGAGLTVHAVDADEVTAALAAYNLAPFGEDATVQHATAEEVVATRFAPDPRTVAPRDPAPRDRAPRTVAPRDADPRTVAPRDPDPHAPARSEVSPHPDEHTALWLDPARRTPGHGETRRVNAEEYSPPLDWVFATAARLPAGIKLGPGHDRDDLPSDAETQWVSVDGSVVELVVWTGILARPGVRRSALVIRGEKSAELTAAADAPDAPLRDLGAYLHEPDGAVIRARLIGDLARREDAGMLAERIAYLTGDSAIASPFAQSFRVRETMAATPKAINAVLRAHDIGALEIKKRGMDIDPAVFRTRLSLRGSASAVLILTRIGARRVAILADRVGGVEGVDRVGGAEGVDRAGGLGGLEGVDGD